MSEQSIVEFEKQVMVMAKQLYPGKSCFSARELNPIREKLKDVQASMRVEPLPKEEKQEEAKVEAAKEPEPVEPKTRKKRKYTKRK